MVEVEKKESGGKRKDEKMNNRISSSSTYLDARRSLEREVVEVHRASSAAGFLATD